MSAWTASQSRSRGKLRAVPARAANASPARQPGRRRRRLHHRARRTADQVRTGGVLDRRRHRRDHGRLVGRDRDLFRLPRRRAQRAHRAPGRAAIRLRRPHRRTARADRPHHQPAIARPGAIRAESSTSLPAGEATLELRADGAGRHRRSDRDRLDQRRGARPADAAAPQEPSPVSDALAAPPASGPRHVARASHAMPANGKRDAGSRPSTQGSHASRLRSIASRDARPRRCAQMEERYEGKARKLRGVLAELGLKLDAAGRRRPAVRSSR